MEWTEEIVSGKELDAAKRERAKAFVFTTQVEEARQRFIDDGWEVEKELSGRKVKLKKPKSEDEQFENRVWMMLYKLGFDEMNRSRKFSVPFEKNGKASSKQIDVFAVDDEIILLIECKRAQKPGTPGSFKSIVEAIDGYRSGVFATLRTRYPNHKMLCVLATENYEVGKADQDHLRVHGIQHFSESAIEYYDALGKQLGKSARYQLLGNLFAGKEIKGMDTTVAAIKGQMGGITYYSFTIEPSKLLKMAYILHRNSAQPEELLPAYQRLIKKSRLKSIQEFINQGGYFPNSIIINIDEEKPVFLPAPKNNQPKDSRSRIGLLELPRKYRSAYVIDGQHRLYGYADSEYAERDSIPVVAFYDMDKTEQIKMFMDINEKQKAVPQTLRTTLNSDLLWTASDMSDRQKALRSRIAQDLGELKKSPLYDRIIVGENAKTPYRQITLPFIDSAVEKAGYLGKYKDGAMIEDGLFEFADIEKSYKKLMEYLLGCFAYIKETCSEEWERTADNGAIFTVNVGVSALIQLFADILRHLQNAEGKDLRKESVSSLIEDTQFYLLPLIDYVEGLDSEKRKEIKKSYGGNGPKNCWMRFRAAVYDAHPEFCPEGLTEWIRDNSMQYNDEARQMLQFIEERIASDFKQILQKEYGADWLRIGIDRPVFAALNKRATDRQYATGKEPNPWDEVQLEECRKIATWSQNWTKLFKGYFEKLFADGKAHNKTDSTEWMSCCSAVGRQLASVKNYSVGLDDCEEIRRLYQLLQNLPPIIDIAF